MRNTRSSFDDEPAQAADLAGLVYVNDDRPGITRRKAGTGFAYYFNKKLVRDRAILTRIRSLAVPPAYQDVWICPDSDGHIQATGRDERGRKQYRYHPRWTQIRDETKYGRMVAFAQSLPNIRAGVGDHMKQRGLPRTKVLATIVNLLETTLIRVGNENYAVSNGSFGLTTLRTRHVAVEGGELRFNFRGKSGKVWRLSVRNRRVAKVVRSCQELPGQHLFQYLDEQGKCQLVTSSDVNEYLRELAGNDFTAKDFRTWAGTVLAAKILREFDKFESQSQAKRNIKAAVERVAMRLGNTPAICRKCYVHPEVFTSYADGQFGSTIQAGCERQSHEDLATLDPDEVGVLSLLFQRKGRDYSERRAA